MPDCKSPYLTASRLLPEYGRKIINCKKLCIAFTSTAQNSTELDKKKSKQLLQKKKSTFKRSI